jgi:hypothetical protein
MHARSLDLVCKTDFTANIEFDGERIVADGLPADEQQGARLGVPVPVLESMLPKPLATPVAMLQSVKLRHPQVHHTGPKPRLGRRQLICALFDRIRDQIFVRKHEVTDYREKNSFDDFRSHSFLLRVDCSAVAQVPGSGSAP